MERANIFTTVNLFGHLSLTVKETIGAITCMQLSSNFINELSQHLKIEFLGNEGYSPRNLARMRKFYATYNGFIKFANSIGKFAVVI